MSTREGVAYEFGPIRIHPHSRTVERDGRIISLPPRAFDVLHLLVTRHGDVVSKAELINAIWPDTHVDESSLPVMISSLRRAIGDDGHRQKYVQTVSKCGYRLIGEVREIHRRQSAAAAERFRLATAAGFFAAFAALVLSGSTKTPGARLPGIPSPDTGAETLYEKGRYAWNLQTKAGILRSVDYYQKAIAVSSGFAPAWAGLAEAYVSLPSYSERVNNEAYTRAKSAAMKALALNDRLADSHVAAGMVALIDDRNFAQGEYELRRAVTLDPDSPLAQGELALCLVSLGRTDEAVTHARRAKELDPLSIRAATDLGIVLLSRAYQPG
jgi:DNA-binding winged helix-turn-helix (wHTH) protein